MSWGLVLSGGIAQGIANIGVLQVLERENLKPEYVAGSSMGAVIGALYTLGYPTDVFDDILEKLSPFTIAEPSENMMDDGLHGGLFRQKLQEFLGDLLKDKTIDDCTIPFLCIAGKVIRPIQWERVASNDFMNGILDSVEPHFFKHDTPVLDAIMASSAVPVLFSPVRIGSDTFIDLCSFGAIPSRTLKDVYMPDIIIATDTQPRSSSLSKFLPKGWRAFILAGEQSLEESLAICDLVIKPNMPYGPFRFDKAEAFVKAGREAAEKMLPEIRKILS